MESTAKYLTADERRNATVESVIELAATQNPNDITTAAIAKHMHVTQGALFRHFPSKEAIWQGVMNWMSEHLLARIDKAIRAAPSSVAAIESVFMAHVGFVCDHPGVPRMLFGELQRSEMTEPKRMAQTLMRRYRERLEQLIETGKNNGAFSVAFDTDVAVTLLIGMIQGLVMQALLEGDVDRMRRDAPRVFKIYLNGIGGSK